MTFQLHHLRDRTSISASKKRMTLPITCLVMPRGKCVTSWEISTLLPRRSPAFLLFSKKHMPWSCHIERSKQTPNLRTLPVSPGSGAGCHWTTVFVFPQRRGHRALTWKHMSLSSWRCLFLSLWWKRESIQTGSLWSTEPITALPAGGIEEGKVWKALSLEVWLMAEGNLCKSTQRKG